MTFTSPDDNSELVAQRTELSPTDKNENPGIWLSFTNFIRQNIGLKPLWLSERWAEARVRSLEIDNEVRLLNAKLQYGATMAEVRHKHAETDALQHTSTSNDQLHDLIALQIQQEQMSPDELRERLQKIISKIEMHGGCVEFGLPEDPDTEAT